MTDGRLFKIEGGNVKLPIELLDRANVRGHWPLTVTQIERNANGTFTLLTDTDVDTSGIPVPEVRNGCPLHAWHVLRRYQVHSCRLPDVSLSCNAFFPWWSALLVVLAPCPLYKRVCTKGMCNTSHTADISKMKLGKVVVRKEEHLFIAASYKSCERWPKFDHKKNYS